MRITLAAKSTADRDNLSPTSERLLNCYAVPAPEGARAPLFIRSHPGQRDFASVPGPFLRAMKRVEGQLYVISNGGLHLVRENGTTTYLAAIPDDPNTSMAGHRDNITIAADGDYFVWDGATLTQPGDGAFSDVGSVAFLDQFTLMSELGGRRIEWTVVGDPADRNALHFATAEARDDKLIRILEAGGYLGVLKEHSVELWGNTGLGGASAFSRVPGSVYDRGILGFNLVTWAPDGAFYIGDDEVAYSVAGNAANPISPPNVNQALREGDPTHCFYFEDRGHQFCVIRFSDRPAWIYDRTMGYWHERSSGVDHKPWDVIAAEFCYGRWYLGDRLGRIFTLGTTPVDASGPMRRTIVSRPLYADGRKFSIPELEILGEFGRYDIEETAPNWITSEFGFPLTDSDGQYILATDEEEATTHRRPGRMWIRLSRDGGHTYGLPKIRTIGKQGEYRARARWHALGQYENLTVEVNMTDPVDVAILSEAVLS